MKNLTIQQFFKLFPDNETCLEHVMKARYGLDGKCPHCNEETKFSRVTSQRAYACQWCGWHVYPCVGTPFAESRTPLQLWFFAIYLFTSSRHGVPAKELQRQLGVTYKCAHRMGHKIREHMDFVDGNDPLSGIVETDETYVGGKKKGTRGRGAAGKTVVFGMVERGGDVTTQVVPNVKRHTLYPIIEENIEMGSTIHTDELRSYATLENEGYPHETVNHSAGEYARDGVHVNSMEGFWSRLKLSIRGTHVHVSPQHLSKYASEFEYRYNSRKNPSQMLPELLGTYQPLTR